MKHTVFTNRPIVVFLLLVMPIPVLWSGELIGGVPDDAPTDLFVVPMSSEPVVQDSSVRLYRVESVDGEALRVNGRLDDMPWEDASFTSGIFEQDTLEEEPDTGDTRVARYATSSTANEPSAPRLIEVDGVRPLVTEPVSFRQVETYLAVNPTDPTNMIATALADSAGGGLAYVTRDGGNTWKRIKGPGDPVFPGGDPMVAFGGDGRAYLSTLASGFSVWRSADGGRSWSGPTEVEGFMDRQWVTASHSSEDGGQLVYATARAGKQPRADIAVFVSEDGGRTFTETARISPDSVVLNSVTDMTVTRDGTVLIPYLFFPVRGRGEIGRGQRAILRSRNGGDTWSGPYRVGEQVMAANTGGRSLHMLLGTGGTAVDESGGKFDGTVYMTWNQVVDGYLQPVLARSRDGGRTWSSQVRVNQGGRDSHHSTPHVAVGPEGVVAVTWNDRRHDPDDQCYHHYVAISRDGGQTFSSERRISEEETCLPPDYRWQNGGDTQGLVPLPDGSFRAVWTGPGPNGPRPWTAEVKTN